MSELDRLFAKHLAAWNYCAEIMVAGMHDLPDHALYAVWICDYLANLQREYVILSTLREAGAKTENELH